MPTFRLVKGIGNLGPGLRVFALVMLTLFGIVLMSPKRSAMPAGTVSDGSAVLHESQKVSSNAKPVQADDVIGDSNAKTAKIVTCPRCRLNALPRVKEFVYDHAKLFEPKLKVDFILGEDPVLHLYDDGKEVEKIDLESYDSKKIIQKLVHFGIRPTTESNIVKEALLNS